MTLFSKQESVPIGNTDYDPLTLSENNRENVHVFSPNSQKYFRTANGRPTSTLIVAKLLPYVP